MNKILIAEDDKYLANAYRVKLTKEGFEVLMAADGEEALKIIQTTIPDLIILDLMMPKKDGFATLQELKANEQWKDIPVIISSNLGQEEDIAKGMKLGAADYIVKSDMPLVGIIKKINAALHPTK